MGKTYGIKYINTKSQVLMNDPPFLEENLETNGTIGSSTDPYFVNQVLASSSTQTQKIKTRAQKFHLPEFVLCTEETEGSDGKTTIFANATIKDMDHISDDNKENIIDRRSLRRQREKERDNLKYQEWRHDLILKCLYFVGRIGIAIVTEAKRK